MASFRWMFTSHVQCGQWPQHHWESDRVHLPKLPGHQVAAHCPSHGRVPCLKQVGILELANSLKRLYCIVQLGSPAHLCCHVNLDTGSYQTWNRDLLRLKCIELGIRQDCLKLRRIVFNRWETDMNDVMKSLNITIHKWHDMIKSKRYPMGITHPPLSLGEISRRIQVSAAAYQRRRQSKKAFLNTQRNPECYQKYLCSACEKSLLSYQ